MIAGQAVMEHTATEKLAALSLDKTEQPVMEAPLLLRLPAELRIKIWELVLTRPLYLHYPQRFLQYPPQPSQAEKDQPAPKSNTLTLLQVCRQIHQETRLLPFHLNTITLPKLPSPELVYGGRRAYLRTYNRALETLQIWQMQEIRYLEVHTNLEEMNKLNTTDFFDGLQRWVKFASGSDNELTWDTLTRQCIDAYAREDVEELEEMGQWIALRLTWLTSLESFTIDATPVALGRDDNPRAG